MWGLRGASVGLREAQQGLMYQSPHHQVIGGADKWHWMPKMRGKMLSSARETRQRGR